MITPNIQKALQSNGVRFYAKDFLMEGMRKDCVDAVHDAKLVYELLKERMEKMLAPEEESIKREAEVAEVLNRFGMVKIEGKIYKKS